MTATDAQVEANAVAMVEAAAEVIRRAGIVDQGGYRLADGATWRGLCMTLDAAQTAARRRHCDYCAAHHLECAHPDIEQVMASAFLRCVLDVTDLHPWDGLTQLLMLFCRWFQRLDNIRDLAHTERMGALECGEELVDEAPEVRTVQ